MDEVECQSLSEHGLKFHRLRLDKALTPTNRLQRVDRCRRLLQRFKLLRDFRTVVFSDEKTLTIEQVGYLMREEF